MLVSVALFTSALSCLPITDETERYGALVSQATPVADLIFSAPSAPDSQSALHVFRAANGRIERVQYCSNGKLSEHPRIGAAEIRLTYTEEQEIRTYWNAEGEPDQLWKIAYRGLNFDTESTIHREIYSLDQYGRRTSLRFEDANGDPTQTFYGSLAYEWDWETENRVIERRTSATETPVFATHFFDFAETRISFDENGIHWLLENVSDGHLTPAPHTGIAAVRFAYDDHLREADMSFYDENDQITRRSEFGSLPYGYARLTYTFNDASRVTEERYLNEVNQLVDTSAGFARVVYIYDADGNYKGYEQFSAEGAPASAG